MSKTLMNFWIWYLLSISHIKAVCFSLWLRYFVWNFKDSLWNFTKSFYPYIERCVVDKKAKIYTRAQKRFWNASCAHGPMHHHIDVIMSVMASQISSLTVVYSSRLFRRRSWKTSNRIDDVIMSVEVLTDGVRAPSQYKDRLIYVWWFPC